jgi:hypothetical protein
VTALVELAEAYPLRVSGRQARGMLRALRRRTGWSRVAHRQLWARPEASFGPFQDLPPRLRAALADAVAREMEERSFTVSDRFYRTVHGPIFRVGSELARLGKRDRLTRGWRKRWWRGVYVVGRLITDGCEALGRGWLDATRFTPLARTSGLHALWKWAGVDPVLMGVQYVDSIPVDARLSPVYRSDEHTSESCAVVGVDLLLSNGEPVFLEANFNPGMLNNRLELYPDGDPVCESLCEYAQERGLGRIVYFPFSSWYFPKELEEAWRALAASLGIELEIRDDPRQRSPWRRSWQPFMDPASDGTLYLNSRGLASPLNSLIRMKGLLEPEIEKDGGRVPEEQRIRIPRRIRSAEDLVLPEPGSRFPNLIVKDPIRDRGTGHTLYKTDRIPEGIQSPPHVMYEYIPPDCMLRGEGGERAEYGLSYRCYLLVTPGGPRYLGAKKIVGHLPVPETLGYGPVPDVRPYVINGALAADTIVVTPDEEVRLREGTLRVGRAIHDFLRRKHGEAAVGPGAA